MRQKLLRYFLIGFGFLTVLAVVLLASLELTSKPAFCSTCHYMEPYVEGWKASTHSNVTCTDCHFPPGFKSKLEGKFTAISMVANYMTGIYKKGKPWAEISDASCLRSGCHQERFLFEKVLFKDKVIFDHTPHLTKLRLGKKLRCTSCHSQIVQGEHITVNETSCFLCHFKNQPDETPINDCTWCHNAPVNTDSLDVEYDHSFVLDRQIECEKCHGSMQIGDGAVPIERCSTCHADPDLLDQYRDLQTVHRTHVTDHKVECQFCHLVIQHKSVEKTKDIVLNCDSCHDNTHRAQINLFSGVGGKNTPPHPNPMFKDGLTCQACHIFHNTDGGGTSLGKSKEASAKSCETCHGEGYYRLLENWSAIMDVKIQFIDSIYNMVSEEVDAKYPGLSRKYANSLMEDEIKLLENSDGGISFDK
ncbi:MAG: cytochrome c3 family protein, partial [Fidelibacterota bacterium]